jgi:transcriptional regulator with XRE-family HTH domain
MDEHAGPVVNRALLRAELRRLRTESGLTQEEVAGSLDWSVSRIAQIERDNIAITKPELYRLLDYYDGHLSLSGRERRRLLGLHSDSCAEASSRVRVMLRCLVLTGEVA